MNKRVDTYTIGVDTGQLLIVDPCNLDELPDNVKTGLCQDDGTYTHARELKFPRGYSGLAVLSKTGYGDGLYRVIVKSHDNEDEWGRVVERITVVCCDSDDDAVFVNTDWELLWQQKEWLLGQQSEKARGLVNWIDGIQDWAIDKGLITESEAC